MLLTLFTANAQSLSCQDVKTFSVKPHIGLAAGTMSTTANRGAHIGVNVGVEGQYQFSRHFALSAGVAYQQEGGKMDDIILNPGLSVTYDNKLGFINMPVLANFYVCKGLALKVGFQPGFLVSKKVEVADRETGERIPGDYEDPLNKMNVKVAFGISYEFNNIVIDGRMNMNTAGIFKHSEGSGLPVCGNTVYQLTVGYRF